MRRIGSIAIIAWMRSIHSTCTHIKTQSAFDGCLAIEASGVGPTHAPTPNAQAQKKPPIGLGVEQAGAFCATTVQFTAVSTPARTYSDSQVAKHTSHHGLCGPHQISGACEERQASEGRPSIKSRRPSRYFPVPPAWAQAQTEEVCPCIGPAPRRNWLGPFRPGDPAPTRRALLMEAAAARRATPLLLN